PGLLRIAVENLLANAWKYTERTPAARIEVEGARTSSESIFTVRDNGVGFDMLEVGKLFTPFQRLRSAVGFEGTGIGLATVRRIVERHGGRVWAHSEPDRGTTFSFSLPHVRDAGSDGVASG
ncbi:MAG: ATP-binding protein, partial [Opitutaceae bacterium]